MEKSVGNAFKDSRNSTKIYIFCICVRIITQIPDMADYLHLIEELLRPRFIPGFTGHHICSDANRALLALSVKFSSLG